MSYQYLADASGNPRQDGIQRIGDPGTTMPTWVSRDPDGGDWRAYQAWLAAGNTPAPAVPVVPPTSCVTGRQVNGQARVAGVTAALNTVLTSTTSTAKPDDIRYLNSVGLDTRMPIDNPKAARVLALAGAGAGARRRGGRARLHGGCAAAAGVGRPRACPPIAIPRAPLNAVHGRPSGAV